MSPEAFCKIICYGWSGQQVKGFELAAISPLMTQSSSFSLCVASIGMWINIRWLKNSLEKAV